MTSTTFRVVKVGGAQLEDPRHLDALSELLRTDRSPTVLVHGGGKEICTLHEAMGVPYHKVEGLRVTSDAGMDLVTMVLGGLVNKRVVAHLIGGGHRAIGVSGVDLGLLRSDLLDADTYGRVGDSPRVDVARLQELLALPEALVVLAPVCLASDGGLVNVNADTVARAIAIALGADRLDFVTDVDAVRTNAGQIGRITPPELDVLAANPAIRGGMIPKLQASRLALAHGVRQVRVGSFNSLTTGTATEVCA